MYSTDCWSNPQSLQFVPYSHTPRVIRSLNTSYGLQINFAEMQTSNENVHRNVHTKSTSFAMTRRHFKCIKILNTCAITEGVPQHINTSKPSRGTRMRYGHFKGRLIEHVRARFSYRVSRIVSLSVHMDSTVYM